MSKSLILQNSKYESLITNLSNIPKETLGFGHIVSAIKNYVNSSLIGTDTFASLITMFPGIVEDYQNDQAFFDRIERGEVLDFDDLYSHTVTLTPSEGSEMFNILLSLADNNGYLHFTDSCGLSYNLRVRNYQYEEEESGGIVTHTYKAISSVLDASGDYVPLLFYNENDDTWTLHTIVFSSQYNPTAGVEIGSQMLSSIFSASQQISLNETQNTTDSIYDNLYAAARALGMPLPTIRNRNIGYVTNWIVNNSDIPHSGLSDLSSILTQIVRDTTGIGSENVGDYEHTSVIVLKTVNRVRALCPLLLDFASNGAMLGALRDICDAVSSKNPLEQLRIKLSLLSNATVNSAARKIYTGAMHAFTATGLQGVVSYISDIFKSVQQADAIDGTLVATCNSDYIPKEFITGVITDVILPAVSAVVGTVLMMVSRIAGAIFYALSAVATGVISAITKSSSEQYVTITSLGDDDELGLKLLPAGPFIGMGVYFPLPTRVRDLIASNGCALNFPVPGGYLFVGFAESGKKYSGYAEFHPYALCMHGKDDVQIRNALYSCLTDLDIQRYYVNSISDENYRVSRCIPLTVDAHKGIEALWKASLTLWGSSSEDVSADDLTKAYARGCQYCVSLFYIWMTSLYEQHTSLFADVVPIYNPNISFGDDDTAAGQRIYKYGMYPIFKIFDDIDKGLTPGSGNHYYTDFLSDWSQIMYNFADFQKAAEGRFLDVHSVPGTVTDGRYDASHSKYITFESDLIRNLLGSTYGLTVNGCDVATTFSPLPLSVNYLYIPPKYVHVVRNLVLAAVGTVVVTAAVVGMSVAYKQITKEKRAASNALASGKRSKYEMAVNGRKEIVHPDGTTETVAFDPSSADGKAYIHDCYTDYKHTAFKLNLQAMLIGGSRYDVGSFWGEADSSESSSVLSKISSINNAQTEESINYFNESPQSDFEPTILQLIRGF